MTTIKYILAILLALMFSSIVYAQTTEQLAAIRCESQQRLHNDMEHQATLYDGIGTEEAKLAAKKLREEYPDPQCEPAAQTQAPAVWQTKAKTDALTGASTIQFSLDGKFLTKPNDGEIDYPTMYIRCSPVKHQDKKNTYNGIFIEGYVNLGVVLDSKVYTSYDGFFAGDQIHSGVVVQERQNNGPVYAVFWSKSTDGQAAFFDRLPFLRGLLYFAKPADKAITKNVFSFPEYLANNVVVQFDMPDPTELADACGLTAHNKK